MIYPASGTQWFNGVLLLIWLYWLDNLTGRYRRYPVFSHRYSQRVASRSVIMALVLVTLLSLSSVYLANRYLRDSLLSSQRFTLYQQHPWWQQKLHRAQQDRHFQANLAHLSDVARHQHLDDLLRQVAQRPRFSGYQHAYQVALQIGDQQRARDIQQEARYLYPQASKVWTTRHYLADYLDPLKRNPFEFVN
ncbi:Wzy polymerase domain-containing protein [Salinivibrio costicola]|uniref:Wzy polymerase domain-containing protein n=1 Tax=Salinivibrio costicola TaxID=51367 RepID=UPI0004706525|nr:Wzy polymerase domain-containing protein [Salinivibrio costicola]